MDFAILLNTASGASASGQGAALGSSVFMIVILLFFVVYMWMMSRREKKNRNEEQTMRDNLKVGDEVVTIGGILGKVVSVKDETVVLETGADRNKIRFTKAAIATNASANARAQADKEAKEAAKAKEKAAKKEGKKKD